MTGVGSFGDRFDVARRVADLVEAEGSGDKAKAISIAAEIEAHGARSFAIGAMVRMLLTACAMPPVPPALFAEAYRVSLDRRQTAGRDAATLERMEEQFEPRVWDGDDS